MLFLFLLTNIVFPLQKLEDTSLPSSIIMLSPLQKQEDNIIIEEGNEVSLQVQVQAYHLRNA